MRIRQLPTLVLLLGTVTGCQYDRSFMQLDSNSGSPFFGLQWSVDSGSRPQDRDKKRERIELQHDHDGDRSEVLDGMFVVVSQRRSKGHQFGNEP